MILSRDTSPDAEAFLIRLLRRKSPREKAAMIDASYATARALTIAGIRQRHPSAGATEIERRYLEIRLGLDLAAKIFALRHAKRGVPPSLSGIDGPNAA